MKVVLKNERTGELKEVKVGWSWVLFFFSGFLGIPLFLRKLYGLGALFLVLWAVNLFLRVSVTGPDGALIQAVILIVWLILGIWVAAKGNELTAKNYLENGWAFSNPDDDRTRLAKAKWKLV